MNKIGILFLLLCLQGIFSILTNKKSKAKTLQENINFKAYSKYIFDELNLYRKQKIFAEPIAWNTNLESTGQLIYQNQFNIAFTAQQEADMLSKNRKSFGTHENFDKYQKAKKGFTEISVNVYASQISSKKIFAMSVLQALKEKYRYHLVQGYTKGGVAMLRDKKYLQKFIIVFHLSE